jgi:hypothetical protein
VRHKLPGVGFLNNPYVYVTAPEQRAKLIGAKLKYIESLQDENGILRLTFCSVH